MRLYLTDDMFFFEEQVKAWHADYPGGVNVVETCDEEVLSDAGSETLFGPSLTVIKMDKLPSAKKEEGLIALLLPFMGNENIVLFFTKATKADMQSKLAKSFPSESVKRMFAFTMDQRVDYLDKHLSNLPQKKRFEIAERAEGMDMRAFRSRVLRLEELRATDDASIDREFPPLVKGESFRLVSLVEKGTEENLAKALLKAAQIVEAGDEPMMVLGTLHWTYRIAYKLAIAPNRDLAFKELGLSGFQASRIPNLSSEQALRRHDEVAAASEQIRAGRDGFEALSAVLCRLSELAKAERRTV